MYRTIESDCSIEIEHLWIPMPDGCRLSARIWLPDDWNKGQSPVPTILEYIPYRKRDMVRARDERNHPVFAANGYACVRVDMRGSGDSEGLMTDMYAAAELDDACSVIDWIAQQPWCDGAVGMMGTSWGGTSALQTASRKDSPLRAVIAVCATNNRYQDDIHHMGGCLLTDSVEWGATLPAILAMPPGPVHEQDEWRAQWRRRLQDLSFPLEHWLQHETCDEYWQHGSLCEQSVPLQCPTLAIGGWSDRYSNTVMNLIEDNPQQCWGIVGSWGHHYPDVGLPGPALEFQRQALRWWDRWLKNLDNGADREPRLRIWCGEYQTPLDYVDTREGHWISETNWPSENIIHRGIPLVLASNRGRLKPVMIPNNLSVGLAAGDTGYFGREGGRPVDQNIDDQLSLILESDVQQTPVQILGHMELRLRLKSSQTVSTVVARISDVSPAGDAHRVSYAIRNLTLDERGRYRDDTCKDQFCDVGIQFPNMAHTFKAGHRIRLALSTSYWPMIWPSPTAAEIYLDTDLLQLNCPCRLRDSTYQHEDFHEIDASSRGDDVRPQNASSTQREILRDDDSNSLIHRWYTPMELRQQASIDLTFGAETSAEHRIQLDDPTSAISSFSHTMTLDYENHRFKVISKVSLTSNESHFLPAGRIQVFEDDEEAFSREWSMQIERNYS